MTSPGNDAILLVCAAALQIIWLGSAVLAPPGEVFWRFAALTALMVAFLHGFLFWVIRRRQQALEDRAIAERKRAIAEIRDQLSDVVGNHLAVIGLALQETEHYDQVNRHLEEVHRSMTGIALQVGSLSEESLQDWQETYGTEANA